MPIIEQRTLSGGEQQRVALARALAPGPKVMLMDEPFSGLDFRLRDQVGEETLALMRQLGAATLMVTHDSDEAMRLADRVALMNHGRIVQQGTPADLYHHPVDTFTATFFSEINRIEGVVKGKSVETASRSGFGVARTHESQSKDRSRNEHQAREAERSLGRGRIGRRPARRNGRAHDSDARA